LEGLLPLNRLLRLKQFLEWIVQVILKILLKETTFYVNVAGCGNFGFQPKGITFCHWFQMKSSDAMSFLLQVDVVIDNI
jgi:hypothetical protein